MPTATKRRQSKRPGPQEWAIAIRDFRQALGYDQERLATVLGVSQAAVSSWESGLREPLRDIYLDLWVLAFNTKWAPVFYKKAGLTEDKLRRYFGVLRKALERHSH